MNREEVKHQLEQLKIEEPKPMSNEAKVLNFMIAIFATLALIVIFKSMMAQ